MNANFPEVIQLIISWLSTSYFARRNTHICLHQPHSYPIHMGIAVDYFVLNIWWIIMRLIVQWPGDVCVYLFIENDHKFLRKTWAKKKIGSYWYISLAFRTQSTGPKNQQTSLFIRFQGLQRFFFIIEGYGINFLEVITLLQISTLNIFIFTLNWNIELI